jgi:hypothetical protein
VLVHETFGRKETPLIHIEEYVQVGDILGIGFTRCNQIAAKINPLLEKLKGPYKDAIHAAYRAKHDLGKID